MSNVMKPDVGKAGPLTDPAPQPQIMSVGPFRIVGGRKHERAVPGEFPPDDGTGVRTEVHGSRSDLAVGEPERVSVDLGPSQVLDLALAGSREQKQADDVGLPLACRSLGDAKVQRRVKPDDLLRRQEPGEPGPRIHPCALGGVHGDQVAGCGVAHDLAEKRQGHVGIARRRGDVPVEPGIHVGWNDPIQPQAPDC